jgi:L-alanine-DL-glutamate epimerase-like enolase superfamily enzyme
VERLILDVQYIGGPLHFLEAARTLQALGCEVGSHTFAHESLHLLAALPQSLPVEVFDWWHPVFNEEPEPDSEGRLAVRGPGLGRTLNEENLRLYGRGIA